MPEITWDLFNRQVEACTLCSLCQNIHHKVPGQGDELTGTGLVDGLLQIRPGMNAGCLLFFFRCNRAGPDQKGHKIQGCDSAYCGNSLFV